MKVKFDWNSFWSIFIPIFVCINSFIIIGEFIRYSTTLNVLGIVLIFLAGLYLGFSVYRLYLKYIKNE